MKVMRTCVAFLAVLISLTACASMVSDYRADADAFCELHSEEQWGSRKGYTAIENIEFLAKRIKETIKTKAFYEMFERLSKERHDDIYGALQSEISKLTGEEWHCDAAKKFYAISWERVGGENKEYEIDIVVLKDGAFEIKKEKYMPTDTQGISDAIDAVSQGRDYKIFLSVPGDTSKDKLNDYLEPFRQMKVKSLSITYY